MFCSRVEIGPPWTKEEALLFAIGIAVAIVIAFVVMIFTVMAIHDRLTNPWRPFKATYARLGPPSLEYCDALRQKHEVQINDQPSSVAMMAADPAN